MILSILKKPRTNYSVHYFVEYLPWTSELSLCFELGGSAICEVSGKIVVRIWINSSSETAILRWHQLKNPRKLNPSYSSDICVYTACFDGKCLWGSYRFHKKQLLFLRTWNCLPLQWRWCASNQERNINYIIWRFRLRGSKWLFQL